MSSTTMIEFDSADQNLFAHNTAEVLIDGSGATLKPFPLETDEMYMATAEVSANADRAIGTPTNYFNVNAFWDSTNKLFDLTDTTAGSALSLNDDSGRDGVTPLTPTAHFNFGEIGTVRAKITLPYNGSPSTDNFIFSTGGSTTLAGFGSLITLRHSSAGSLILSTRNSGGGGEIVATLGSYVAVAGETVEWEFSINSTVGTCELYLDGVLFGSGSVRLGANPRDYFYFGADYTGAFTSELSVEDIQIFNEIQHTSNFTGEIPRAVNIYPSESRIVPSETITAEGIVSFADNSNTPSDSAIRYQLKIESTFYYLVGGVVTVSDGTYAQSTSLADWNANVDAVTTFIASGAKVTMIPVLQSGVKQTFNPSLVSTTIVYDFFAFPTSCTECTLYGFIKDNCRDVVSGTVRVYTKKPIPTQGNIISIDDTVNIRFDVVGNEGFFEMPLVIPNYSKITSTEAISNGRSDTYKYEMKWVDSDGKNWSKKGNLLIPNATSAIFNDVVVR